MPKLEIKEHKKLVLQKVVIKELRNIPLDQYESEITKFENQMKIQHVQTFGPLVTRQIGTQIHEDGSMSFDYDLMIQADNYKIQGATFKIQDKLVVNHCLYVRFSGHPQYMNYAQSKLDLHIYENDLLVKSDLYTVFVGGSEDTITVDYFKPVDYETL